jgi:hypothetical protein
VVGSSEIVVVKHDAALPAQPVSDRPIQLSRTKVKESVEAYKKGLECILNPVQYADYEKGMKALTKKAKDKKDGGSN